MRVTVYYLCNRLVDKKDIPANAKLVKRVKIKDEWGGNTHYIFEKYYEIQNKSK